MTGGSGAAATGPDPATRRATSAGRSATPANEVLAAAFQTLATAQIADACVRLGIDVGKAVQVAPPGVRPVLPGRRLAGRALPARHVGSVDVFLEAIGLAHLGDVLVVDNGGRTDEGCVGDLVTLAARQAGLVGMVVWGFHRDTEGIRALDFPVFSCGTCPFGPLRLDPRPSDALTAARFGDARVTANDVVFADDDGVLFVGVAGAEKVLRVAGELAVREARQAALAREGRPLAEQFRMKEYLARRARDPGYTFGRHLREVDGAIGEEL